MQDEKPSAPDRGNSLHRPKLKPGETKKEKKQLKGLCANCSIRKTCTIPKPDEGIWHCDKYC